MFTAYLLASSPGASSSGSSSSLKHTRQSPIQTTTSNKPTYKQLSLPTDWTVVREHGIKLYLHTPSGVVTDKDPRCPKAHKVIKGQFTKFVGATRRGSAELSELLVFPRRGNNASPMEMRTKTKAYQHKIRRSILRAPPQIWPQVRVAAHVSLVEKRDCFCRAIRKDLRPVTVKRGWQPVYFAHPALRAEVIKGELKLKLETIVESD